MAEVGNLEGIKSEEEILHDLGLVKYEPKYYGQVQAMLPVLGTFYDGHGEGNRFADQLVGKDEHDEHGYFTTKKKFLILPTAEDSEVIGAFIVLNFKRGGSVKIGPFIVNGNIRGRGFGTELMIKAEEYLRQMGGVRKMYATTSHLNTGVNRIFEKCGFAQEARYPSHYRSGSEEIIWGKFLEENLVEPIDASRLQTLAAAEEAINGQEIEVVEYEPGMEDSLGRLVLEQMRHWHDDVDPSFVANMIRGSERGLDFERKGKVILVARDPRTPNSVVGVGTLTPKRGNPAKLYPLIGPRKAQRMLGARALEMSRSLGLHKVYTFAPEALSAQHELLIDQLGMTQRGTIQAPYKRGVNMRTYDRFI